ncbi:MULTISPECIES: hypothetical protein [Nocardiopsis]|uniref:Uncharacterized protein n=1 Tax=Nocardiopsis sinuspersici TaxID=501010 RepID=A0A1V3C496_9ACTN|nr:MULTISPECIES: hypothetical protein [Nocardiopsis]NYH51563.1 hypothetical protein [Nocardiopsis sinuspersici]OOC55190.1 hypothetical protein NOSIN_16370 [Nocardiopsis sinuspersici]
MPPFTRSASGRGHLSEHARLLQYVLCVRERSTRAVPWEPHTVGVPAPRSSSALARINDVAFYANAREEVSALAGVCVDLLYLHTPVTGEHGECHCGGCLLAWPCPTFARLCRLLA